MRREIVIVVAAVAGLLAIDLGLRHEFYRDLNGPSWAVVVGALVFEVGAFWLFLRHHAVLRALYLLITFASWAYFLELKSLPGVFGASYMMDEPRDALNLAGAGFSWGTGFGVTACVIVAILAGKWLAPASGASPPAHEEALATTPARWPRRSLLLLWLVLALMLRHNLAINPGTALPFTDGIYAIGLAVARRASGVATAVRLTERTLAAEAAAPPQDALPKPLFDTVLIIQESLRAHNVSAFGYARKTTPQLDAFLALRARDGASVTRFSRAYANATQTAVSVPSILAGRAALDGFGILRRSKLIYEELKRHLQVKTALIASHSYETGNYKAYLRSPALDFFFYRELGGEPAFNNVGADDAVVAERFAAFLSKMRDDERFFAVLHLNGTHYPYTVPAAFVKFGAGASFADKRRAVDRYDDSIAYVDSVLGTIIAMLERRQRMQTTVVAMTSDHGESFGEDGTHYHFGPFSDWNARVPALLVLPESSADPGRRAALAANAEKLVENLDLVPTLRELYALPRADFPGASWLSPLPERTVCLSNGVEGVGVVKSGDAAGKVENRSGRSCG